VSAAMKSCEIPGHELEEVRELDPDRRIIVHHRTVDTLGRMLKSGAIDQAMYDAARDFQANLHDRRNRGVRGRRVGRAHHRHERQLCRAARASRPGIVPPCKQLLRPLIVPARHRRDHRPRHRLSAKIRAFASALQRRRPTAPVITSTAEPHEPQSQLRSKADMKRSSQRTATVADHAALGKWARAHRLPPCHR
jgi:hypothetical protein